MGIAAASPDQYEAAFRKLFPLGEYWDRQFADPRSDVSLFCKAKLPEFARFRGRMAALRDESRPQSADELLDEWERALRGSVSRGLDARQRRLMLLQKTEGGAALGDIQKLAGIFGFAVTGALLPYRPAFFGFSRFGVDRMASPAAWQAVHIFVSTQGKGEHAAQFEAALRERLLASHVPYFFYDGGKP